MQRTPLCNLANWHMKKKFSWIAASLLLFSIQLVAQPYQLSINLTDTDGSIPIALIVPPIKEQRAYFVLPLSASPKNLPLKQRISQFAAYDVEGKHLPYEFGDDNIIFIEHANQLQRIEYRLLLPADTPLEKQAPYYLISRSGYFGYIEGYRQYPYHINILHPQQLYGASSWNDLNLTDTLDKFELTNYEQLLHSVLLYAPTDTTSFAYNGTRYHIAVYSETGKITARQTRYPIQAVVEAAAPYLQYLPKQYHFIFKFSNQAPDNYNHDIATYSGYADAAASFYALPETYNANNFYDLMQPQVMHELLHSIAPFALHSHETDYGGMNDKGIGKHLWLYEGVTEYLSRLLLLRGGMSSEADFWHEISRRIKNADHVRNAILTDLSEYIYRRQQGTAKYTAYNRGMVVAFYLDVLLQDVYRRHPNKANMPRNLLALLAQLIAHYKGQAFDDDALFDDIIAMTSPEIGDFLYRYIADNQALPHHDIATLLGMQYFERLDEAAATFGDFQLLPDYRKEQLFFSTPKANDTKHVCLLPFKRGDRLLTLNGDTITTTNINRYLPLLHDPLPNIPLLFTVVRQGETITLSAMPRVFKRRYQHAFRLNPVADNKALRLKKIVLSGQ